MKRLRVILLFLLLGAIVNVGVAWGLAVVQFRIHYGPEKGETGRASAEGDSWRIKRFDYFGATRLTGSPSTKVLVGTGYEAEYVPGLLPSWSRMNDPPTPLPANVVRPNYYDIMEFDTSSKTEIAHGWPLLSLNCTHYRSNPDSIIHTIDGILLHVDSKYPLRRTTLPLRPIWTGFALNTILYAVLLRLPFALRRLIRRRRGLCVKCAYDLRGTDHKACPECGHTC